MFFDTLEKRRKAGGQRPVSHWSFGHWALVIEPSQDDIEMRYRYVLKGDFPRPPSAFPLRAPLFSLAAWAKDREIVGRFEKTAGVRKKPLGKLIKLQA
jgi:hypothetical protein